MKKTYEKPALDKVGGLPTLTANAAGPVVLFSPFRIINGNADSDRRLKTNVTRVGTTVFGLPLYRFSYLGSSEMFTGVMAQDVLGVMPRAVSRNASGFYRVNYGMLGIEMKRAT